MNVNGSNLSVAHSALWEQQLLHLLQRVAVLHSCTSSSNMLQQHKIAQGRRNLGTPASPASGTGAATGCGFVGASALVSSLAKGSRKASDAS